MKSKLKYQLLIPMMALASACSGPKGNPSLSDGMSAGQVSISPQVTPIAPIITDQSAVVLPVIQKARLQKAEDGTMNFEYLLPDTSNGEVWKTFGKIEIRPAGTQFHHWGPEADVKHWSTIGITADEIDRAVRSYDASDVMGGGFYMSLDSFDSSSYGTNLIVAEPQHDVISMDLSNISRRFNRDLKALTLSDENGNLVATLPISLIAESGVEMIRYTETWNVIIRATVLERLFEGSWANFLTRTMQGKKLAILDLFRFAVKYPIDEEVINSPEFQIGFPTASKLIKKEQVSKEELDAFIEPMMQGLVDGSLLYSLNSNGKSGQLNLLAEAIQKPLSDRVQPYLQKLLDEKKYSQYESMISQLRAAIQMKLVQLKFGDDQFIDIEFFNSTNVSQAGVYASNQSVEMSYFKQNLVISDFFADLNLLVHGVSGTWKPGKSGATVFTQMENSMYKQDQGTNSFEKVAKFWSGNEEPYRSQPAFATGPYQLDGPAKPGYIRVSKIQKEDLEKDLLLIVKSVEKADGPNGETQFYVQYEYPSARNYRHFAKLLSPQLVERLKVAEKAKKLMSTTTTESKTLTRDILKYLVDSAMNDSRMTSLAQAHLFFRIHAVQGDVENQRSVLGFLSQRGGSYLMLDSSWEKSLTYTEFVLLGNAGSYWSYYLAKTLNPNADKIDLNQDIGIWEVASDYPGPHNDPQQFIQKVRARFESAEVQGLLKTKNYPEVRKILKSEGAGL
jgi:hypothetical protein